MFYSQLKISKRNKNDQLYWIAVEKLERKSLRLDTATVTPVVVQSKLVFCILGWNALMFGYNFN